MARSKPADLWFRLGRLGNRRKRTLGDYLARMMLLSVLFATIICAAQLNAHFTATQPGNRCLDFNARVYGGTWDCITQQRIGGWRAVGTGIELP